MMELKTLKVRGFRAYTEDKEFTFDNPAIFLFGENHRGKSSTLNAVEWCLFGNECIGEKTLILERKHWEIPNRNIQPPNVLVEVELKDKKTGEELTITRKWVSARKDELKVILRDGESLRGEKAREKLVQLLKSSFRDFLTTVYQHQEAIRAILTQDPRERNEAIDRLLGLPDYRNILRGIEVAKLGTEQRKMGDDFDNFVGVIDAILHSRENDLKDKRVKAVEKGLKGDQLCEKGALGIASKVKDQLLKFASEVNLSLAELRVPEQWRDLHGFKGMADGEIKRFRSEMPDVEKQKNLFKRKTKITGLKEEYKQKENDWNSAKTKSDIMGKESAELQKGVRELEKKITEKQKERSEMSARGAVITEALNYLRLEGVDKNTCPVCGTEKTNLLYELEKERAEKYEKLVGAIQGQLDAFNNQRNEINTWFEEYNSVKRSFEGAYRAVGQVKKKIGEALGREITAEDDPDAILSNALKQVDKRLEELEQAVNSKQKTLDVIAYYLEGMQLILDILSLEEKNLIVEQIQKSSEYRCMEELKDQMAILVNDVEKIKQAISEASHEAAEQKVTAAGEVIDNYFHRIANNPSISKIAFTLRVDSRGLNSYVFEDQNGKDLTPILSQGDMNAMALSIFLGMAGSKETNQPFGFIILDDPSQSLGAEHKEKLVEVLNEVLDERIVILSSADRELQDLVLSKITKAKTKYVFSDWTPERGPEVNKNGAHEN